MQTQIFSSLACKAPVTNLCGQTKHTCQVFFNSPDSVAFTVLTTDVIFYPAISDK